MLTDTSSHPQGCVFFLVFKFKEEKLWFFCLEYVFFTLIN